MFWKILVDLTCSTDTRCVFDILFLPALHQGLKIVFGRRMMMQNSLHVFGQRIWAAGMLSAVFLELFGNT